VHHPPAFWTRLHLLHANRWTGNRVPLLQITSDVASLIHVLLSSGNATGKSTVLIKKFMTAIFHGHSPS